jgi:hypothetical protein
MRYLWIGYNREQSTSEGPIRTNFYYPAGSRERLGLPRITETRSVAAASSALLQNFASRFQKSI